MREWASGNAASGVAPDSKYSALLSLESVIHSFSAEANQQRKTDQQKRGNTLNCHVNAECMLAQSPETLHLDGAVVLTVPSRMNWHERFLRSLPRETADISTGSFFDAALRCVISCLVLAACCEV